MSTAGKPINIPEATRKLEVDNRVSLRYYYRIADNLLQEANIHRDMKNVVDLYIVLLKFSSLLSETIPCHKDFTRSNKPEKDYYKKKLLLALKELETLRLEVEPKISRLNKAYASNEPVPGHTDDQQATQGRLSAVTVNVPQTSRQQTCSSSMKGERWVGSSLVIDSFSPKTEKVSSREDGRGSTSSSSSSSSACCVVCFEGGIEGACVPCGHMAGCMACLNEIKAQNWGCPVCRTPIQQVLRLYAV
nr:AMSH-like ubiquitin thioesterase 3 [Ipomoea batatas]